MNKEFMPGFILGPPNSLLRDIRVGLGLWVKGYGSCALFLIQVGGIERHKLICEPLKMATTHNAVVVYNLRLHVITSFPRI